MAFVLVQSASTFSAGGSTPLTATLTSHPTAGNLLVVEAVAYADNSSTNPFGTPTDTSSTNTFHLAAFLADGGTSDGALVVYYAWNCVATAGADTVSITCPGSTVNQITVSEFSGVQNTSDPLDVANGAIHSGASSTPTVSITASGSNGLVKGWSTSDSGQSTVGTTTPNSVIKTNGQVSEWGTQSGSGAVSVTSGPNDIDWNIIGAVFKAAATTTLTNLASFAGGSEVLSPPRPRIVPDATFPIDDRIVITSELWRWEPDAAPRRPVEPPVDQSFLASSSGPSHAPLAQDAPAPPRVRLSAEPPWVPGVTIEIPEMSRWDSDVAPPPRPRVVPESFWVPNAQIQAPELSRWDTDVPVPVRAHPAAEPAWTPEAFSLGSMQWPQDSGAPKPPRPPAEPVLPFAAFVPPTVAEGLVFGNDVVPPRPKIARAEDTAWIGTHLGTYVQELSRWDGDVPVPVRRYPVESAWLGVSLALAELPRWELDVATPARKPAPDAGAWIATRIVPTLFAAPDTQGPPPRRATTPDSAFLPPAKAPLSLLSFLGPSSDPSPPRPPRPPPDPPFEFTAIVVTLRPFIPSSDPPSRPRIVLAPEGVWHWLASVVPIEPVVWWYS